MRTLKRALLCAILQVSGCTTKSNTMHWILFLSEPSLHLLSIRGTSHCKPPFDDPPVGLTRLLVATATCTCHLALRGSPGEHLFHEQGKSGVLGIAVSRGCNMLHALLWEQRHDCMRPTFLHVQGIRVNNACTAFIIQTVVIASNKIGLPALFVDIAPAPPSFDPIPCLTQPSMKECSVRIDGQIQVLPCLMCTHL